MRQIVRNRKSEPGDVYFFYTTCPKCAKAYGKNYVVGIATVD
ncbi:hydrolase [Mesorhizobium sp. ORM8.1]